MGVIQRETVKVTIISYIGIVLGYVNKAVLFVLLLTPEEIGLANLILSLGVLFSNLSQLGSVNAIWKFLPYFKDRERDQMGFFALNLYITTIGVLVFSGLYILFKDVVSGFYESQASMFVDAYYLPLLVGIPMVYFMLLESYLRALYKNVVTAFLKDILLRVLLMALIFLYWKHIIDFDLFILAVSATYLLPLLVVVLYAVRLGQLSLSTSYIRVSKRFRKIIWSFSSFSYLNQLGNNFIFTIDTLMITSYLGLGATGVYTTVLYIVSALLVPYKSFVNVLQPKVAELWKNNDIKGMHAIYGQTSTITLFLSLFIFLGVWSCLDELFFLLGAQFESGKDAMLAIFVGRMIGMYMGLNNTILMTSKKYRWDLYFTAFLIALVIALNFIFIPIWGLWGAAFSTTIAFAVYNMGRVAFVWFFYKIHPFRTSQVYLFALFGLNMLFLKFVPLSVGNMWADLVLKVMAVCILFPVALLVFRLSPEISEQYHIMKGKLLKRSQK